VEAVHGGVDAPSCAVGIANRRFCQILRLKPCGILWHVDPPQERADVVQIALVAYGEARRMQETISVCRTAESLNRLDC
jgi:hypothetical protein